MSWTGYAFGRTVLARGAYILGGHFLFFAISIRPESDLSVPFSLEKLAFIWVFGSGVAYVGALVWMISGIYTLANGCIEPALGYATG